MKKADFIVIGAVAAVVCILLIALYGFGSNGNSVTIEVDGKVTEELPLDTDARRVIETDGGVNVLVIENGEAVMTEADCPDGICTAHKPISRVGESIICLPHKVVVTVVTDSDSADGEVDAVA